MTEGSRERGLDPALLEHWRRTGLRLDREGRWWHEGDPVEHDGLRRALFRWLDRLEDGRFVLRLDEERFAFVEVEDTPFIVRTLDLETTSKEVRITLHLNDGREEELAYGSLSVAPDNALTCEVYGRFRARFSRGAYYLLGELIEETDAGFSLRAAGQLWPVDAS